VCIDNIRTTLLNRGTSLVEAIFEYKFRLLVLSTKTGRKATGVPLSTPHGRQDEVMVGVLRQASTGGSSLVSRWGTRNKVNSNNRLNHNIT
jgi:hypothetical protein